ncbi:MAG TPA: hypothetical protein VMU54_07500, partial [Planctomycetota bacterium]|nr:hypothetical protein [Planctomycetota bacterium]
MTRTSLTIALLLLQGSVAAPSQEEAKTLSVIGLRLEDLQGSGEVQGTGLLYREVLRQTVLLAAREGLGLPTRDQALREPLPEGAATLGFSIQVLPQRMLRVSLSRGEAEAKKTIWETSIDLPPSKPSSVHDLAPLAEPWSRGPLVDALKQAGFAGKAAASTPGGAVPEGVERRLRELTFTGAYAALHQLHGACRETGESPARLGALVRAYANLGQLSRGLWNASSKVFAARSLLYAQRLLAAAPGTRIALWHRAYALTMAGRPGAALEDLAGALAITDSQETAPVWVPWLEACCRYETPKLDAEAPAEDRPLQRFLAYLTAEGSESGVWERGKAAEVLKLSPECYRVIDAACAIGGVNNLHSATMRGPQRMGSTIYGRVKAQPDLPQRVLEAVRALDHARSEQEGRVVLWKSLLASPEPAEPSWPLLGRLIEETSFMQTVRRGNFLRYQWGVPCDQFVQEVGPLIADHPYGALVRSYVLDARRQPKEWAAL